MLYQPGSEENSLNSDEAVPLWAILANWNGPESSGRQPPLRKYPWNRFKFANYHRAQRAYAEVCLSEDLNSFLNNTSMSLCLQ
ncbi:unnamed protein product [Notodromas monacha]|uniref:Uncharacterized protein n=1 Tax=Notodromas monacha TaxID=399045 RepID=A0A7R9BTE1_9CRUS|nr:unnamed protein product [Notodromas monacha]CAG0921411.1 unnamed protein product [Notodromas monacha]